VSHCIGVANGTDALELLVRAYGIGAGDEVILPANTFIATALAVARTGATPVLVDVDARHLLIDPSAVLAAITERTRGVIAVHLYGQMAPMEELAAICDRAGLLLMEDAAQSQGAQRHGVRMGQSTAGAGTSFYPGKNLGAYGDAGAIVVNDDAVAAKLRALRNYGSEVKYHHPETGFNSRLDTMQAAVLSCKLARLDAWNAMRRQAAEVYTRTIAAIDGVEVPGTAEGNEHVWHLYVVRVAERDRVLATLNEHGVGAGIHYPVPVHLQGAFAQLGLGAGAFPITEQSADTMISLPMYPGITEAQQERVVTVLAEAVR
jgi:dTDP-4-amino-4,6-dideoxygalactose transaminase